MLACAHMAGFLCFTTFYDFLLCGHTSSNTCTNSRRLRKLTVVSAAAAAAPLKTMPFRFPNHRTHSSVY